MILKWIRVITVTVLMYFVCCFFSIALIYRPFNNNNNRICANILGWLGLKILGIELECRNFEGALIPNNKGKDSRCVLIANHQDTLDVIVIGRIFPKATVIIGKRSLLFIPFFGIFFWLAGNIFINRKKFKSAIKTMDRVKDITHKTNSSVFIFPEGTRSWNKGVGKFKKGAFYLAIQSKLPLRPMVISSIWKSVDLSKIKAGKVILELLPDISCDEYQIEDVAVLVNKVRQIYLDKVNELDNELDSGPPVMSSY